MAWLIKKSKRAGTYYSIGDRIGGKIETYPLGYVTERKASALLLRYRADRALEAAGSGATPSRDVAAAETPYMPPPSNPYPALRPIPVPSAGDGWVYFIQRGANGPIKIGYSDNSRRRIAQLQTGSPEPLRELFAVRGSLADEAAAHAAMKAHRIRGEWFHPASEVMALISWWQGPTA